MPLEPRHIALRHPKRLGVVLEKPADRRPQSSHGVTLEQLLDESKVQRTESRSRRHELGDTADERELPEALDQRALRSGRSHHRAASLDAARSKLDRAALHKRGRVRREANRRTVEAKREPLTRAEERARRPRRVRCTEKFKRAVMGENRVWPRRMGNEKGIRPKRARRFACGHDRVDPTSDRSESSVAGVVAEPRGDGSRADRGPEGLGELLPCEHRVSGEEAV